MSREIVRIELVMARIPVAALGWMGPKVSAQ
jgi:hypothetical protein